jgi:hypothetical protein
MAGASLHSGRERGGGRVFTGSLSGSAGTLCSEGAAFTMVTENSPGQAILYTILKLGYRQTMEVEKC